MSLKKLFSDLEDISEVTFNEFWKAEEDRLKLLLADSLNGECSILFTEPKESEAAKIYNAFRDNLEDYFRKTKVDNVFINLGAQQAGQKAPRN